MSGCMLTVWYYVDDDDDDTSALVNIMMTFWHCIVKNESFILTVYMWLYKDSVTNLIMYHECKGTNKNISRWDYDYSNNGKFSDGFLYQSAVKCWHFVTNIHALHFRLASGEFCKHCLNILIKEVIPLQYIYKELLWN